MLRQQQQQRQTGGHHILSIGTCNQSAILVNIYVWAGYKPFEGWGWWKELVSIWSWSMHSIKFVWQWVVKIERNNSKVKRVHSHNTYTHWNPHCCNKTKRSSTVVPDCSTGEFTANTSMYFLYKIGYFLVFLQVQWGKHIWEPLIGQVVGLKKMTEIGNFHHRYT